MNGPLAQALDDVKLPDDPLEEEGTTLWVNVRAIKDAIDYPRHTPCAYVDKQSEDDVRVLVAPDERNNLGQIIKGLQDKLRARNKEIRTLRELYCAASASNELHDA